MYVTRTFPLATDNKLSEKQQIVCPLCRQENWPREVKSPADSLHQSKQQKEGSILRFKSRVRRRPAVARNRCREGKKAQLFFFLQSKRRRTQESCVPSLVSQTCIMHLLYVRGYVRLWGHCREQDGQSRSTWHSHMWVGDSTHHYPGRHWCTILLEEGRGLKLCAGRCGPQGDRDTRSHCPSEVHSLLGEMENKQQRAPPFFPSILICY